MIAIGLIVGFLFCVVALRITRGIDKHGRHKGALYHVCRTSLDFLVPFIIGTSLFLLLSLIVSAATVSDSVSLGRLIWLEEQLSEVRSLVTAVKLTSLEVLGVLLLLYALGFVRALSGHIRTLFRIVAKYQRFVWWAYITAVFLSSLTFFGTQLGEPTHDLTLRIKTIREGYAELSDQTEEALVQEVAVLMHPEVTNAFPKSYQDALGVLAQVEQETDSLGSYYALVRGSYSGRKPFVESLLHAGDTRAQAASALALWVPDDAAPSTQRSVGGRSGPAAPRSDKMIPPPMEVSFKKIADAKNAVREHQENLRTRGMKLLARKGAKEVVCQVPKVFTEQIKKAIIQQLVGPWAILEGPVEALFRTVDRIPETKLAPVIERLATSAVRDPHHYSSSSTVEASAVANNTEPLITREDLLLVDQASDRLKTELATVKGARETLFRSVVPKDVASEIRSNLSVQVNWTAVPGAQSYRVYWLQGSRGSLDRANSETTEGTSLDNWPDGFPVHYRVTAIRDNWESDPSTPHKVALRSHEGGTKCQICGSPSIGYCSMRQIYVCDGHHTFTARGGGGWVCP